MEILGLQISTMPKSILSTIKSNQVFEGLYQEDGVYLHCVWAVWQAIFKSENREEALQVLKSAYDIYCKMEIWA